MIKIVEIAWIIVAVISALEVIRLWGSDKNEFWFFVAGIFIGIFMFYFRRKQRLRWERMEKEKQNGQLSE